VSDESPTKPDFLAADPRVPLAAERTLLAWVRTGLAMMGFGFVVARFGLFTRELAAAQGTMPPGADRPGWSVWFGTALVLLGVITNVLAAARHARYLRRLRAGDATPPASDPTVAVAIALLLAMVGAVMAGYLVLVVR
jgi:putative membrane protein